MSKELDVQLQEELINDLMQELSSEDTFNESLLKQKVKNAIREVKTARRYPISYSKEQIINDLYTFYSNIRSLALYDYNSTGAEFEISHNENSINRTWIDRNKLFNGVLPLSKF
jgi:hypothetical protein